MEILEHLSSLFWSDYIWLPPDVTWEDIRNSDRVNYAQFHDLHNGFKIALVVFVVRYVLKRYIFTPMGCHFGLGTKIVNKINDVTENSEVLEKAFRENGNITHKQVPGLAKQLDWSERKVERWIRHRVRRGEPTTLNKFTEEAWRFTFSLCAFCYGLYALWDKPWLWDSKECFINYPHHGVTNDVWWYYMIEVGLYWCLNICHSTNTKEKDFLQYFVHHVVSILLLTLSWTCNLFRIGSLVLLIHDFSFISLKAAKVAKCVRNYRVANACFAVFTVAWIFTRLVFYPYRVIYYAVYVSLLIVPQFPPAYYVFNSLLFALQVLHIVWTWTIVKITLRSAFSKNPEVEVLSRHSDETNDSSSKHEAHAKRHF